MPGVSIPGISEEQRPEYRSAFGMCGVSTGEEVRRKRNLELGELAENVAGFVVVEPWHTIGVAAVETGV